MYVITVDETKCKVCGECISVCPVEIYKQEGDRVVVGNSEECSGCQSCLVRGYLRLGHTVAAEGVVNFLLRDEIGLSLHDRRNSGIGKVGYFMGRLRTL